MLLGTDAAPPGHTKNKGEGIFQYAIALWNLYQTIINGVSSKIEELPQQKASLWRNFHRVSLALESEWNLIEEAH